METCIRLINHGKTLRYFFTNDATDQLKIFHFMKDNNISLFSRDENDNNEYLIEDICYLFPNKDELPIIEVWVE